MSHRLSALLALSVAALAALACGEKNADAPRVATATVTMTHFFTGDVHVLADTVPALADALDDADIDNTGALAAWCKRVADSPLEGFVLRRHGRRVGRGQPWKIHTVVGVDERHCFTDEGP